MIVAAFESFGISAALMLLCAVYCCWNSLSDTRASQEPGGLLMSVYLPEA